jgi:hypothetical protein
VFDVHKDMKAMVRAACKFLGKLASASVDNPPSWRMETQEYRDQHHEDREPSEAIHQDAAPMALAAIDQISWNVPPEYIDISRYDMRFMREKHCLMILASSATLTKDEQDRCLQIGVRDWTSLSLVKKAIANEVRYMMSLSQLQNIL